MMQQLMIRACRWVGAGGNCVGFGGLRGVQEVKDGQGGHVQEGREGEGKGGGGSRGLMSTADAAL